MLTRLRATSQHFKFQEVNSVPPNSPVSVVAYVTQPDETKDRSKRHITLSVHQNFTWPLSITSISGVSGQTDHQVPLDLSEKSSKGRVLSLCLSTSCWRTPRTVDMHG